MFTTVKDGKGTFKIKTAKLPEFQLALAKASKIRRKPVTGGVSRSYPLTGFGAMLSTEAYVREYMRLNPKDHKDIDFQLSRFEPLSNALTVPEGVDSCEVEP